MLKFLFCCLLGLNLLLFALGKGYLGPFGAGEHEPARLSQQLNADKIRLVTADQASASAAAMASAAAATEPVAPAAPQVFACTEVGNFVLADARRFEAQVAPLQMGDRQSRRNVQGQDISSYIVYLAPLGSKENADRKVAELKQLGVQNYFVISDNTPLRWAISLGVFKTEKAAQVLLAGLVKQGVRSARVSPRYSGSKQLAYQFRDLDVAGKARLQRIAAAFPEQELRNCR